MQILSAPIRIAIARKQNKNITVTMHKLDVGHSSRFGHPDVSGRFVNFSFETDDESRIVFKRMVYEF